MAKSDTLKAKRQEAARIVAQLNAQLEELESKKTKLVEDFERVLKDKSEYQKLIPQVRRTSRSARQAIEEIRNRRDSLKKTLSTIERFYRQKYLPLKEKIDDPKTGMKANLKAGIELERSISKIRGESQKELGQFKRQVREANTTLKKLGEIVSAIEKIQLEISSREKSVSEMFVTVEGATIKVEAATKTILEKQSSIIQIEKEIQSLKDKSDKNNNEIESIRVTADDNLGRIQEIYQIAVNSGLGGEFDRRRGVIDRDLKIWLWNVIGSTFLLLIFIGGIFILQLIPEEVAWDINKIEFNAEFYLRFLVTSPIIYYLIFATGQFRRSKALLEKYAFKSTLALSIEAHIKLLTNIESFQDEESKYDIREFIIQGFAKIYDEPFQNEKSYRKDLVTRSEIKSLKDDLISEIRLLVSG